MRLFRIPKLFSLKEEADKSTEFSIATVEAMGSRLGWTFLRWLYRWEEMDTNCWTLRCD